MCPTSQADASDSMTRVVVCAVLLALLGACRSSSGEGSTAPVVVRRQQHMSTEVTISVAAPESLEVLRAIEAAFAEVARLTGVLSEWHPESETSAVNHQAGAGPVQVSADTLAVLAAASDVSQASDGAFDATCGALVGLWDFRSPNPKLPSAEQIAARLPLVDHRQVELDPGARTVRLKRQGMRLTLGGIAKGYIVDRASAVLRQRGFPNHLISAGGDMFAAGRRGARRWTIGIYHPRDRRVVSKLALENQGAATSGNYERFVIIDGVRYHHILDPRTGRPVRGLSSVTVVADSAMLADAYATAVFVLGRDEGLALAGRQGFDVHAFDESFATFSTPTLRSRLRPVAGPSRP